MTEHRLTTPVKLTELEDLSIKEPRELRGGSTISNGRVSGISA
jgi:hypothetical protein